MPCHPESPHNLWLVIVTAGLSGLPRGRGHPRTSDLVPLVLFPFLTDHTPHFVFIPVKAGGMRIVQKHPHSGDAKEEKDKDDQEWESPRWESSGDPPACVPNTSARLHINVCSLLCAAANSRAVRRAVCFSFPNQ